MMPKLTQHQKELIREEIYQLRLFAMRHRNWWDEIDEPAYRKPHRYIHGELNGLADEIDRMFFGTHAPRDTQDE
jgi:hypothetical protein